MPAVIVIAAGTLTAWHAFGPDPSARAIVPVLHVTLSPMLAAAAMSLGSVSAIVNALRLRRVLRVGAHG